MKTQKVIVVSILTLLIGTCFVPFVSGDNNSDQIIITVNESDEVIEITYEINDFEEEFVDIDGTEYSIIKIGEESNLLEAGNPDIPNICRSIVIPDTAKMKVNVVSTEYIDYNNVLIAPSKGNLLRTVNPDDIPFEFGEVYNIDDWFPGEIAELREPYILRDFRGQVVEIYPIQYNPVTKVMRFYNEIAVEVVQEGEDTINCIYREELPEKVDFDFKLIYEQHFINFGISGRYNPVGEQGNLLIICYDDFMDEMQPLFEWKTVKGIPTEMVKVSEIGDANAIKTYIENYYNENGLTFVILVGDVAQIPTLYIGSTASDPSYTYIVGGDHYPDLFVGRFSAQNSDQVTTQVERSVEYEKNPQVGAEWYHKGTGVASNQGPGDDGEYDDEHMDVIRDKLMAYTYTEVDQIYDPYATSAMVTDALNDGRSVTNYCGHGSPTSWGSSGFSNSDINNLVNDNMLPYVTCVACNNGQFDDYDECFCEAWLRATSNGEPTGGIAATGSSKGMSWSPPMDAQDEMMDLLVESYTDNVKHTIGGIHYNGVMHMNDEYGSGGYSETDTWHVFGDPSLQIRTNTPIEMTVNHGQHINLETLSLEVTVNGVEGALCAISRDGELFGSAYTDASGDATIELDESFEGTDPVDLIITAYNKIPYTAEILVNQEPNIPSKPDGPTTGQPNIEYAFTTSTIDPDGDQVYYQWSWGDGYYEWFGPYESGETVYASHKWSGTATYGIRVMAKDIYDLETEWSEKLYFKVEKSRSIDRPFLNFLENHPNLLPLLRLLIQRLGL
ncbi:MAG: PKD domain-containing protein [Thermoplasmatales archaeon]|nr:PKD domain-containing protein [Thermoplasmatales archaeon]